jgi:hypothetical protein
VTQRLFSGRELLPDAYSKGRCAGFHLHLRSDNSGHLRWPEDRRRYGVVLIEGIVTATICQLAVMGSWRFHPACSNSASQPITALPSIFPHTRVCGAMHDAHVAPLSTAVVRHSLTIAGARLIFISIKNSMGLYLMECCSAYGASHWPGLRSLA